MDALHANIGVYTNSSSTPCKLASTGEYAIGLSTDLTAPLMKTKGAPIDIVIPVDKTAWDIEAKAMLKGSKNREAAKTLLDWGTSREANEEFIKFIGSVGLSGSDQRAAAEFDHRRGRDGGRSRPAVLDRQPHAHHRGMVEALQLEVGTQVNARVRVRDTRADPAPARTAYRRKSEPMRKVIIFVKRRADAATSRLFSTGS